TRYYESVSKEKTDRVLRDTSRVTGLQANQIRSVYAYGYRRVGSWVHLGVFASGSDSEHDFYKHIGLNPKQERVRMYFPYDTPLEARAAGAVLSLSADLEAWAVPLGRWTLR